MASGLFTALACIGAVLTLLLYLPPRSYGQAQLVYFLLTFLWGDVALFNVFLQVLSLPLWWLAGAFSPEIPWIGVLLMVFNWAGLYLYHRLGHRSAGVLDRALENGLGRGYRSQLPEHLRAPVRRLSGFAWLRPFPLRVRGCRRLHDIPYGDQGERHHLDLYLPARGEGPWPVLLHIHGGGFFTGHKKQQGYLLFNAAPAEGWAVVSMNYRVGPDHRMPAMIEDVKRAIHWLREHGAEYGMDPRFIVTTGGSAGGALALMAALTPDDPGFQPGFEQADTRVQGCIALYGPNDLLGEHGCFDALAYQALNTRYVMPCPPDRDRALWERCSPMHRISGDLPPMMVLGGSHDPLVSAEESRQLIEALEAHSRSALVHAILPYTNHAFDQSRSSRGIPTIQGIIRFLAWLRVGAGYQT